MKSPWKFVAQIVSRRRPSETPAEALDPDSDHKSAESPLAQEPALQSASHGTPVEAEAAQTTAVDVTPDPIVEADDEAATAAAESEQQAAPALGPVEQADAEANAVAASTDEVTKPAAKRTKPSKPASRGRVDAVATAPVAAAGEPAKKASAPSANPFLDEATSIDEDIRQLKEQLAQKLRLQNAQLRKMLERFDRG